MKFPIPNWESVGFGLWVGEAGCSRRISNAWLWDWSLAWLSSSVNFGLGTWVPFAWKELRKISQFVSEASWAKQRDWVTINISFCLTNRKDQKNKKKRYLKRMLENKESNSNLNQYFFFFVKYSVIDWIVMVVLWY